MPYGSAWRNDPHFAFEYDVAQDRWTCSTGVHEVYGLQPDEELTTSYMLSRIDERDRAAILNQFERLRVTTGPFSCDFRVEQPGGQRHHVVLVGESEGVPDDVKRLIGYMVDITDPVLMAAREAVNASAEHRAHIEQAKGMLMSTFDISADAAFAVLQRSSQNSNVKLRDVAHGVLERATGTDEARQMRLREWLEDPTARMVDQGLEP